MTKADFLENFVTSERIKRASSFRDDYRRINHAVLQNRWSIPGELLTALRRHLPPETNVEVCDPLFRSEIALRFSYPSGELTLLFTVLDPPKNGEELRWKPKN